MSYEDDDQPSSYSRGHVHVNITFEVTSEGHPDEITKEIEAFITKAIDEKKLPYPDMSIHHIELDGSEIEYADWDYEDRINHYEDLRDERRLEEES